ncbi:MAG: PEGA domain-containing protein [Bacteroidota bacterium]|nr:PEGA domain-containing protein [Bacteroidota bacterium]MDP4232976.1 PEGA domain-containing protein [Bacteroidota bacterium]MDP4242020.1 PEGA domain-containing protein [Bacteroidota bacterium]MDP4286923.1 PEGA domain-containing protein [Bacteroidota bacterium]
MKIKLSVLVLMSALAFNSCSTIVNGSKQEVNVRATPEQAKIYIDGELAGTGSATTKLTRGKEHVIEVKLDNYRTAKVTTDKSITGWFWGNLICGGIPGGAVDLITGSAYDVDPDHINVTLERGTGMLEVPVNENFGHLTVNSPEGERLASIDINWQ